MLPLGNVNSADSGRDLLLTPVSRLLFGETGRGDRGSDAEADADRDESGGNASVGKDMWSHPFDYRGDSPG